MPAEQVQRLDLKDLDAVLARAKAEGWTELALPAGKYLQRRALSLQHSGWPATRVFILNEPLRVVPEALVRLKGLTALNLQGNQIGNAGAKALARLNGLTSLQLASNQIGDAGAEALGRLTGLTSLQLWDNKIGDAGAEALARLTSLTSLGLSHNRIGDAGAEALALLPTHRP